MVEGRVGDVESALLCVSELVTNAVLHAGTPCELTNVLQPTVVGPATGGMPPGTDPTALGPSYTGAPNYEPPRRNGVFIAVLVVLLALLGVLLFLFARTVLGDEGAQALAESKAALAHIDELDVSQTFIS